MKSLEIKFMALKGEELFPVEKLIFDRVTFVPSSIRLAGSDYATPIHGIKLVAVPSDTENANSITVWEEETVEEPKPEPKPVRKPKK